MDAIQLLDAAISQLENEIRETANNLSQQKQNEIPDYVPSPIRAKKRPADELAKGSPGQRSDPGGSGETPRRKDMAPADKAEHNKRRSVRRKRAKVTK